MQTTRLFLPRRYQKKSNITLFSLPYEIWGAILQYISAYDAAKLSLVVDCILPKDREKILNPVRDLIWNISEMEELLKEGMKLLLLGSDVPALTQRLHHTEEYLKEYGTRRLKIYLIGTFPIRNKITTTLNRMVKFSTTGKPSRTRVFKDKYQLRQIKLGMEPDTDKTFLMAFGAPLSTSGGIMKGAWYKVSVPDRTIDLRLYTPCFSDRIRDEVIISPMDIVRMSKLNILHICTGGYQLRGGCLTALGLKNLDDETKRQTELDFVLAVNFLSISCLTRSL